MACCLLGQQARLAILHRLRFGVSARVASVRARFVVRLTRFNERETDQRCTLRTRAEGNERCRQRDFRHGMSLAPISVAGMAPTLQGCATNWQSH
jgi:hypothetical protein